MKIAISGKGGSGKTTLAATLARTLARRGLSVLAIDGDPNPNLGTALGIADSSLAALHPLPRTIIQEYVEPSGDKHIRLTEPITSITCQHGVVTPDGVSLLMTGRVDHAGAG